MSAIAERFWSKVMRTADCWLWGGGQSRSGYGKFGGSMNGRKYDRRAHRIAWELTHGHVPAGLRVLHRCDNRLCVNPAHLFLGTDKDNVHDCIEKGRRAHRRGEQITSAKLTQEAVAIIRGEYASGLVTQRALADRFGVDQSNISLIVRGKIWAEPMREAVHVS